MAVRIISSVVAIVFAIVILLLSDTIVFNLAISAISVGILYELFSAVRCKDNKISVFTAFLCASLMPILSLPDLRKYQVLLATVCVFLIFLDYIINHKKIKLGTAFFMISAMLLISYSMSCLVRLKYMSEDHGLVYVILALCGGWLADSGAYFTGTFLGKHKLCPEISPKKTVEGLIGGVLTNGILFVVFSIVYVKMINKSDTDMVAEGYYFISFILGAVCALVGTAGDLVASLIKRQCKIKDYGNIMPGHGGLLDRFDSVLFVVPFFYAFLTVFNIFK
ncbi:MAG TPA: phosphatidate cytidylyltransferase [Clostridiales bacterium]|nr:phosphatidate cytidylyltransferase [Clostridiales bacterium]